MTVSDYNKWPEDIFQILMDRFRLALLGPEPEPLNPEPLNGYL